MAGFFKKNAIPVNTEIYAPGCSRCGLSHKCATPEFPVSGKGSKAVYVIGNCPSSTDDRSGKHFSGKSGLYLSQVFKKCGISLDKDCYKDFAIRCKTTVDKIKPIQLQACANKLQNNVKEHKPSVIILLGSAALEGYFGSLWKKEISSINKWRGFCIPDRRNNAFVFPVMDHKIVYQSKKKDPVLNTIFRQDIKNALSYVGKKVPVYEEERSCVNILNTEEEQVAWMKKAYAASRKEDILLAFDYESTGLKPHAKGHKIACISMCYTYDEAVVFMFPLGNKASTWLKRLLTANTVKKTAHNIKFEDTWTTYILGYDVHPWKWCSMQAAHVIDNRQGIAGLKFQLFINFGLPSYDDVIAPYLKGIDEKNANSLNRVFQAPRAELLLYCGIDSLGQYRLAVKQMKECNII